MIVSWTASVLIFQEKTTSGAENKQGGRHGNPVFGNTAHVPLAVA